MWFNNALVFLYTSDKPLNPALDFEQDQLKPCPAHARFTYGWVAPFDQALSHDIAGSSVICLGKEERMLPKSVIQRQLNEKIKALETARGFAVKRAERAQMAEDIEFDLLPKAFCLQKKLYALIDTINQRLIINTSSPNQASQLLALIRKSIPGISIEPLQSTESLTLRFTDWINHPAHIPEQFELSSDCLLSSLDDEKKRFSCKGGELSEIQSLLAQGYSAAEISILWHERIQFTLTQTLAFKRIKCMDYLQDEVNDIANMDGEDHQRDAKIMLLSGELRSLIDSIIAKVLQSTPVQQTHSKIEHASTSCDMMP